MANDGTVKIGTELDESGLSKGLSGLGDFAKKGAAVASGVAAAGVAAAGAVTKAALDSVASLEQNIGGVETLFGATEEQIQRHIEVFGEADASLAKLQNREKTVLDNANKAYKTAGLSANEYMSTVNSFAASLTSSLGDYAWQAGNYADMAVTDMADNANKMGSSMESIQNAYQGFAKQNYTMLDNLKLGYGGTKTEMERLLRDAEQYAGLIEGSLSIDSFADVVDAIHIVQEEMGIAGTTAKEAATTIEGSMSAAKASWDNFLSGAGTAEELAESMVTAGEVILKNLAEIIPRLAETIPEAAKLIGSHIAEQLPSFAAFGSQIVEKITSGITTGAPTFAGKAQTLISDFAGEISKKLPEILNSGVTIISSLVEGLLSAAPQVIQQASQMLTSYVSTMMGNIPAIMSAGTQLLLNLLNSLVSNAPKIIQQAAQMIIQYAATILQNLPQILQAGIQLIGKLLAGIIQAVPQIISAIPSMMSNIGQTFLSYDWLSIGKNIISGITSGITSAAGNLVSAAVNAASSALNSVKSFLGIHSPSTVFRDQVGKQVVAGMAAGIEKNTKTATTAINKMTSKVIKTAQKGAKSGEFKEAAEKAIEQYTKGVESKTTTAENAIQKVVNAQIDKLSSANKDLASTYSKLGKDVVTQYSEALESATETVKTKLESKLTELAESTQEKYDEISKLQSDMQARLSEYATLYTKKDDEYVVHMLNSQIDALNKYESNLSYLKSRIGEKLMAEIASMDVDDAIGYTDALMQMSDAQLEAYSSQYDEIQSMAERISKEHYADQISNLKSDYADQVAQIFNDLEEDMEIAGKNAMQGFLKGLKNSSAKQNKEYRNIANSFVKEIKAALGIHSPSTVLADEVGEWIPPGIVEGADKQMPKLDKSMKAMAEEMVEAFNADAIKTSASDFVARMQAKSYKAAESNEMSARSKWQNNGYDPENPDDDGGMTIHNQFNVDGKPLVDETVKKTKKEIAKEQRSNQAVKGDVVFA